MEKEKIKLKEGEKSAEIISLITILLTLGKGIIGFLSGSMILITDALHSATDLITILASWFGLRIARRKPTEKFPYGYYKAENLATLFISIFIIYTAFEFLLDGYLKLFTLTELTMPLEALGIAFISIIVSYFMSKYLKKMGEKINSQSLIANSKERLIDVFSSTIVFIGILLTFYKIPYTEGIITMGISILILKMGLSVGKDSIFALMDVSPSKDIEKEIKEIINSSEGIEGFKNLRLRKSGPFVFGEVKIKIKKNIDVKRAHEIADKIENEIKEKIEEIDSFTIHIEPYEKEEVRIAIPIKFDKGLDSEVMEKFGRSNYFIFINLNKKEGKIKSVYVKENPYKEKLTKAGFSLVKFLIKEKIDILITKEIGGISFHTLRDNLIEIYKAEGKTVKEIINNLIQNNLKYLDKPTKEEEEEKPKEFIIFKRGYGRGYMGGRK